MVLTRTRAARLIALPAMSAIFGLAAAGCGSSAPSSGSTSAPPSVSKQASVAYASSLQFLNEKVAGPAFSQATGYQYAGHAGASGDLEQDIASGELSPNVFESVGGDNIEPLFPKFTKWYIQYAGTSIVVAYNPQSKYASQFKAIADGKKPVKDLFALMEKPGFKLGRTDPNIDPQGRDFIFMLELAQSCYHLPADTVTKILGGPLASSTSSQIFDEAALPSHLSQLDASSAFVTQAIELKEPYIKLPDAINLGNFADAAQYAKASITITSGGQKTLKTGSPQVIDITLIGKPTPAGTAFVKYTLSPAGLAQYKQGGFKLLTPTATGTTSAIPAAISNELGS